MGCPAARLLPGLQVCLHGARGFNLVKSAASMHTPRTSFASPSARLALNLPRLVAVSGSSHFPRQIIRTPEGRNLMAGSNIHAVGRLNLMAGSINRTVGPFIREDNSSSRTVFPVNRANASRTREVVPANRMVLAINRTVAPSIHADKPSNREDKSFTGADLGQN